MRLVRSLSDIGTSLSRRLRSIPPSQWSSHLESHLLAKQKELLDRHIIVYGRRWQQCRQRVAEIEARLANVRQTGDHPAMPAPTPQAKACEYPLLPSSDREQQRFRRMTVEY